MILFNILKRERERERTLKKNPQKKFLWMRLHLRNLTFEEIDKMTEKYEELNDTDFLSIKFDSNPMIKSVKEKVSTFRVFLSAQLWF